jgi:hypothetical protein
VTETNQQQTETPSAKPSLQVDTLISGLRRMASNARSDADLLDGLANKISEAAASQPASRPADFAPHVIEAVFRTLNNSSSIGTAQHLTGLVGQ